MPLLARWPGRIPAGTDSNALFSQVDLLATFAWAAGIPVPEGEAEDSLDQLTTFVGAPADPVRRELIVSPNRPSHLMARRDSWVYIPAPDEGGFGQKNAGDHCYGGGAVFSFTGQGTSDFQGSELRGDAPAGQLYDLNADPGQAHNVYTEHPEIVAELAAQLARYRAMAGPGKPLGWIDRR